MYTLILILHILVAILLIGIILVQRGRSSGLIEALGGVESIFGTKTSSFLVKLTVILAALFICTSLSLVYLSKKNNASLLERSLTDKAFAPEEEKAVDATKTQVTTPQKTQPETGSSNNN